MVLNLDPLVKVPPGFRSLGDITNRRLPQDRPILVAGRVGCSKTSIAIDFPEHGKPAVSIAFQVNEGDLRKNVASLDFDSEKRDS